MKKLWPYLLGLTVLLVGAIVSSRMLPKDAAGAPARKPVFPATQLQPVRVEKPPEALYFLVAQALVEKLKTGDLLLTVREYRELIRQTSLHLREDLGLELPAGFILPPGVPQSWLEHPEFSDPDHDTFLRQVQAANRDYLQKIVGRLLDEYASQTMQLMVERLAAIQSFRKPGDAESLSFVKALYGESFVNDYAAAHRPKEDQVKAVGAQAQPAGIQPGRDAPGQGSGRGPGASVVLVAHRIRPGRASRRAGIHPEPEPAGQTARRLALQRSLGRRTQPDGKERHRLPAGLPARLDLPSCVHTPITASNRAT